MNRFLWWGVSFVGAALGLGIATGVGLLTNVDTSVFKALAMTQAKTAEPALATAQFITTLGDPDWRAGIMLLILVALVYRRCWRSAAVFTVTVALSIAGHSLAKELFARSRPALVPPLAFTDTYSYPSGHAAGAMVILLLGTLLLRNGRLIAAGVLLALAIGASRVALGVHWPSDVVGGWLFGGGTALIGYAIARRVGRTKENIG